VKKTLRQEVRARAAHRCEYCHLKEEHEPDRPFHVEHVIATKHGGGDHLENLAFACQLCNLLKGPSLASIDPETKSLVRLFHPRKDIWAEHFRVDGAAIVGTTDIGRTTTWLLEMNSEDRLELRLTLIELGEWP
jgi:hypothetical protein